MRKAWVALGCGGVLAVLLQWPMGVAQGDHGEQHPGEVDTTCAEVLDGKPGWELEQETVPAPDSDVHSGQIIDVRLTWDAEDFADAPLYHALDCVTVEDRLRTGLSLDERNAPNDGEVTHRFEVPRGLVSGTEICSRGAIAGDGNGYFELNPSNDACFTLLEDPTPPPDSPPVCSPGESPPDGSCTPPVCAPSDTPPDGSCTPPVCSPSDAPPDASCTPPPQETPTTPPADVRPPSVAGDPPSSVAGDPAPDPASPPPREVEGIAEEGPAEETELGPPLVGPITQEALPRTGRAERTLFVPAGLLLAIGGAALISATQRPVRPDRSHD